MAKGMKVEVKEKELIITIPRVIPPEPSKKTGKTLIIATSHGNVPTTAEVNGQVLTVGINAYIKNTKNTKKS